MELVIRLKYIQVLMFLLLQMIKAVTPTQTCSDIVKDERYTDTAVHNGLCYLFVNKQKYWRDARDYCWNLGGEMVVINDQQTMDFIIEKLNSETLAWRRKGVWLGARYRFGAWHWTNGEKVTYGYWASGEPSKIFGLLSIEDCVNIRKSEGWRWHDYPCGGFKYYYNFICQFPLANLGSTSKVSTPTGSSSSTSSSRVSSSSPLVVPKSVEGMATLSHDLYVALWEKVYRMAAEQNLHTAMGNSGGGAGKVAQSASGNVEDNGNTTILNIIITTAVSLLFVMLIIFILVRRHHKQILQKNRVAVHYANNSYNNVGDSHPDLHNRPPAIPPSNPPPFGGAYIQPRDVGNVADLYTEVNKPSNPSQPKPPGPCECTRNHHCTNKPVELGACGGSDPDQDLTTPLMLNGSADKLAAPLTSANGNCSTCGGTEYVDMQSMSSRGDSQDCLKKAGEAEKHTYTNVGDHIDGHRNMAVENLYEVLP